MSDFTAIRAVSITLQALLEAGITNATDPQLAGVKIFLQSPKFLREEKEPGISLWLYRIQREPDTLNHPPERISASTLRRQPMPLTLHYLVCAVFEQPKDEQALLGKVVQLFHDQAIVRGAALKDALEGEDHELRLVFEALTLEELARVWEAIDEPYRISLSYSVQVVTIDSDLDLVQQPPVLTGKLVPHAIEGTP
jgi:hypothetical protein